MKNKTNFKIKKSLFIIYTYIYIPKIFESRRAKF